MIDLNDVLLAMSNIPVDDPIAEIWGRGLQGGYKIIEYTGSLPLTINANGDALLDYRIYGASGGVGDRTENLWNRGIPIYVYAKDYKKYNQDNAIALNAGTYTISSDGRLPIIQAFSADHTQSNIDDAILYDSNCVLTWDGMAIIQKYSYTRMETITLLLDCVLTFCVSGDYGTYFMLNSGSTALPYEPYGYKLPMVSRGENLFDGELLEGYYSRIYTLEGDKEIYRSFRIQGLPAGTYTVVWGIPVRLIRVWQNNTMYQNVAENITSYTINTSNGDIAFSFRDERQGYKWDDSTWVMLVEGSTAPTSYIPYSRTDTPVYIGENQIAENEYVSFGEQKIYRNASGTLTPTDPPVPLPEIPTIDGETVIDYDGEPKPSQMHIKYKGKG